MMVNGIVYDIMRYSLHDGPGIRTTVFMKGCPLSCQWCANPESQTPSAEFIFYKDQCLDCNACTEVCRENAVSMDKNGHRQIDIGKCSFCNRCVDQCYAGALRLVGRSMSVADVLSEVKKDHDFYLESGGGVSFSGGEPLFQPEFLTACLEACKAHHLHTAVETAGAASWSVVENLRHWVDLFLFDLKTVVAEDHIRLTGACNQNILENLKKLVSCQDVIIRIPMIPGINDQGRPWKKILIFLEQLQWRGRVDLLPYHRLGLGKYAALNKEYAVKTSLVADMETVFKRKDRLVEAGFNVRIHGG